MSKCGRTVHVVLRMLRAFVIGYLHQLSLHAPCAAATSCVIYRASSHAPHCASVQVEAVHSREWNRRHRGGRVPQVSMQADTPLPPPPPRPPPRPPPHQGHPQTPRAGPSAPPQPPLLQRSPSTAMSSASGCPWHVRESIASACDAHGAARGLKRPLRSPFNVCSTRYSTVS